tara:strand:+ start:395 stop:592 length:198 start_codon:yes stop_codon:yes gene_type:complete
MINKFHEAVNILKPKTEYMFGGIKDISTEEEFNTVRWKQDDNSFSTNNPHLEITWIKVKEEMDKL